MKLKLNLPEDSLEDWKSFNEVTSEAILPNNVNAFRRRAPKPGADLRYPIIHERFVLWVCLQGRGALFVDGISYVLHEDEATFTFPGQPHMRLPLTGDDSAEWLLIRFDAVIPEWLRQLRGKVLRLGTESQTLLKEFANSFVVARRSRESREITATLLRLGLLLNSLRDTVVCNGEMENALERDENDYIRQVCRLMISPDQIDIPFFQVARRIGVSPGHLRRVFKSVIGGTPAAIKRRTKSSMAEHLLIHSTLNISQIAEKTGFKSVYSFSRFFRQRYGETPSKYRKSHSQL